jgi:hypothetical protein
LLGESIAHGFSRPDAVLDNALIDSPRNTPPAGRKPDALVNHTLCTDPGG